MKNKIKFNHFLILFILIKCLNCTMYQYFDTCADVAVDSDINILSTSNGKVKGQCLNVPISYSNGSKITNKVFRWLSIPYADPPINQNRFKSPIPVTSWTNVLNGTEWPNRCMQFEDPPNLLLPMSEDCLYLNVFVRADTYLNRNQTLSPILVFIHGGSFIVGKYCLFCCCYNVFKF